MSSDQRSSLCHPTNLLGLHESQLCRQHFAIFQEDQLNFGRFPVFPGKISNSSRFPRAVDTLWWLTVALRKISTLYTHQIGCRLKSYSDNKHWWRISNIIWWTIPIIYPSADKRVSCASVNIVNLTELPLTSECMSEQANYNVAVDTLRRSSRSVAVLAFAARGTTGVTSHTRDDPETSISVLLCHRCT